MRQPGLKTPSQTLYVRELDAWIVDAIERARERRKAARGRKPSRSDMVKELLIAGLSLDGESEEKRG